MKKHKCRKLKNMINRGVDVLVIIPYNGQVLKQCD
ncbi:D-xylose-binding periplasmic protein [Raoultella ornithinolytica]|nr:D-xylose-binding periplasmic protein [Raoultella ornithinolytica]